MKNGKFCGFNGFQQFGTTHARKTEGFSDLSPDWLQDNLQKFAFSWSFNAFSQGKEIVLCGLLKGVSGNRLNFTLPDKITSIGATYNFCLVLLENGQLFKVNTQQCILEELNFTTIERPRKRSIFGEEKERASGDPVEFIACGRYICVAITKSNCVYNVPSKIHEFPKHIKITSLVCGYEHALALTSNGDLYSWGNGLRGQLGHPELKIESLPTMVEALAGLKVIAIAAGGWHSAAISSFGDLYLWGSNINGQLGLPVYTIAAGSAHDPIHRKNPTVYSLPQICETEQCCGNDDIDDFCSPVQVSCGARHTLIRNKCGKVYFCGWNEHNQFGKMNEKRINSDKFTEIMINSKFRNEKIYCGPWCSVLMNEKISE